MLSKKLSKIEKLLEHNVGRFVGRRLRSKIREVVIMDVYREDNSLAFSYKIRKTVFHRKITDSNVKLHRSEERFLLEGPANGSDLEFIFNDIDITFH